MTNLFEWQRAMRRSVLPGSTKLLLWTLSSYAKPDRTGAHPSTARLCADTGLGRARLFALLAEAEKLGWVERISRSGKASEYVLCLPDPSSGVDGSVSGEPDDPSNWRDGSEGPDPSCPVDGLEPYPSSPLDGTRPAHWTHNNQRTTTGGAPPPDPRRTADPKAGRPNDALLPDRADGPEANPSPKPDPPPRARRHLRAVS